ncbi:hypothetical protein STEG23_032295, partial [Scotinomys teguina]
IDEKRVNNTQEDLQNASPKQRKQSVYTPPAIKGTTVSFLRPYVEIWAPYWNAKCSRLSFRPPTSSQ